MSTGNMGKKNVSGQYGMRMAGNLTAIYEPIV
jgi:hypothetical protein